MSKKFMGLDGTGHFWDRAKAWILGQITSAVTAKIAEVVANAPEDLDTLKEIADWISAHANDAAAMNTQITENKNNIAALQTSVAGKADKLHTHTKTQITDFPTSLKNPNALTVNGKTYDGSSAVNAGVQTVANGGTGATDAKNGFMNLANGLKQSQDPQDTEYMIYKSSGNWGLYTLSTFWEYIKGKISSVLGLTKANYGGKAATAGTADKTVNDISIDIPYIENGQFVIPFGNIPEPTSTATDSPYNWDITGFFSIIRPTGHIGSHLWFAAGHGYSHSFTTYVYLDKMDFSISVEASIKTFQYEGKWWIGLCLITGSKYYFGKMTITFSRDLPATPTCILYNSDDGVANEEINNSIQDIPSSWWKQRTIYNPTTFTQNITAPNITNLEQRVAALESKA